MNQTFSLSTALATAALAAGIAMCSTEVRAAPVSYAFVVKMDAGGALANQTLNGSFSYDDAASRDGFIAGERLFAMTAFNLMLGGHAYTLPELDYGDVVFQNGAFNGLDASDGLAFSFIPGIGNFGPSFIYDNGQAAGFGSLQFRLLPPPRVPEPAGVTLVLTALAALSGAAAMRLRRRSSSQPTRA